MLLRKRDGTKLALYFLPYIPETTLSVLLKENKLMFTSPGDNGYAKVLFLNQLRSKSVIPSLVAPTLDIHHEHLPQFFDFYIWSHVSFKTAKLEKLEHCQILTIPNATVSSLRVRELTTKHVTIVDFCPSSDPHKKVHMSYETYALKQRPIVVMRINSTFIDINNPQGKGFMLRSEQAIEQQVVNRIGTYYDQNVENVDTGREEEHLMGEGVGGYDIDALQNHGGLPFPILRVFVKNRGKKFLRLRAIEEKLEGLVANTG